MFYPWYKLSKLLAHGAHKGCVPWQVDEPEEAAYEDVLKMQVCSAAHAPLPGAVAAWVCCPVSNRLEYCKTLPGYLLRTVAIDMVFAGAQVRRFSLEKWLNEPFFETAVAGAVARVSIRGSYMMAEVLRVVEREPGVYKCAPNALGSWKPCVTGSRP